MIRLRRILAGLAAGILTLVLLFAVAAVMTARSGDPALFPAREQDAGVEVLVINNGYHSGLVVRRDAVAMAAAEQGHTALAVVAKRFAAYEWLEVGWGEARFYRDVPTIDRLNWRLALSALLGPNNESVLHIVGLWDRPEDIFREAERVPIRLSTEGAGRLFSRMDGTFALAQEGLPEELGPGLYGPSLFYRAHGHFHIGNVCNHWIANLLDAAGVPTAPVLATLPRGLVLDLTWRSGLMPQAATPRS